MGRSNLFPNLILDGKIMQKNLQAAGKDSAWLNGVLAAQGCQVPDVFLAAYDPAADALQIYRRGGEKKDDKLE